MDLRRTRHEEQLWLTEKYQNVTRIPSNWMRKRKVMKNSAEENNDDKKLLLGKYVMKNLTLTHKSWGYL